MTVQEFYNQLRKLKPQIKSEVAEYVQSQNGAYCPIVGVCKQLTGEVFDNGDYEEAAEKIGLRRRDANKIACSADDDMLGGSVITRNRLLRNLGVKIQRD